MSSEDIAKKVIKETSEDKLQQEGERRLSLEEVSANIQHALQQNREYWVI